jgi:hypothetical protein
MNDSKSDYLERKILNHVLGVEAYTPAAGLYVSLHTGDPGESAGDDEVIAGDSSYARKVVTFDPSSTDGDGITTSASNNEILWTNLPTTTVTHIAIWDAVTGGAMLYKGELVASKEFTEGEDFVIHAGSLIVGEK